MSDGIDRSLRVFDPTASPFPAERDPVAQEKLAIVLSATAIHVSPPKGMEAETSEILAEKVAEALRIEGIPALTGKPPRNARFLNGTARVLNRKDGKALVAMDWTISASANDYIDGFTHEAIVTVADEAFPWETMAAADQRLFVTQTAERISGSDDGPGEERELIAKTPIATKPEVCIEPVSGAPGDGNDLLTEAMIFHLTLRNIPISKHSDHCALVTGSVRVRPNAQEALPETDSVAISWLVLDSQGDQVGSVDQQNNVPHGSLNGTWKEVAQLIAGAAVEQVIDLARSSTTTQ